jgi:hypothetical protein
VPAGGLRLLLRLGLGLLRLRLRLLLLLSPAGRALERACSRDESARAEQRRRAPRRRRLPPPHTDTCLPARPPRAALQERQDRRETWNEHFAEIVNSHFRNLPSLDVLGDMPEHCMKETVANKVMLLLGSGIMLLQAATVYFALNTLFSIPMKLE